jgi:hypothetical protein
MGIAIGAAEKHVCVAAADGRFGNRYQVVLTRGEIAADYAVMNDIIDPASKTGKEVVGNGGCRDDRFGVVAIATIVRDRAVEISGDCCRVDAIAQREPDAAIDRCAHSKRHGAVAFTGATTPAPAWAR